MHTLPHALPTESLSVAEQASLIATAQAAPSSVVIDSETGEERTVYAHSAAADAALERLTLAFLPAIRKAAASAKSSRIDFDEAFSAATEAFVLAVREHDLSSSLPFSATIATILDRAVGLEERAADLVRVRDTVAKVYARIMREHNGDVVAAYAASAAGETGLAPSTFLAVHEILSGFISLSTPTDEEAPDPVDLYAAVEGPEGRIVDEALSEYLFNLVTPEQEQILRLAYGFQDDASDDLRVLHGHRLGEILSDAQIAPIVALTRPTTQRRRVAALDVMREALTEEVSA